MATNETKQGRYAAYIDSLITISPKSQATIAKEIGYKTPTIYRLSKVAKFLCRWTRFARWPTLWMLIQYVSCSWFSKSVTLSFLSSSVMKAQLRFPKTKNRYWMLFVSVSMVNKVLQNRSSRPSSQCEKFIRISSVARRSPLKLWSISSKSGCSTMDAMYAENLHKASRISSI